MLASTIVEESPLTERTAASACYASVLDAASRSVNGPVVTRATLRAFAASHPDAPAVRRALNELRFFPTLSAGVVGVRYARPALSASTRLTIDTARVRALEDAGEFASGYPLVNVYMLAPRRPPPSVYLADVAARLAPLALEPTCGVVARPRLSRIGDALVVVERRQRAQSTAVTRAAGEYLHHAATVVEKKKKNDKEEEEAGEDIGSEDTSSSDDEEEVAPPTLAERHPVPPFDGHVRLYEEGSVVLADGTTHECNHTYVVDGHIGYTSSTTFLKPFLKEFDDEVVSANMVSSPRWSESEYYDEAMDAAARRVRDEWADIGAFIKEADEPVVELFTAGTLSLDSLLEHVDASLAARVRERIVRAAAAHIRDMWKARGTAGREMHALIEAFFNDARSRVRLERRARSDIELRQFLRWHDEWLVPAGYEPFRVELCMFDTALKLTGTIDALFRHRESGRLIMVDWKRSKKIDRVGYTRSPAVAATAGHLFDWTPTPSGRYDTRCSSPIDDLWSDTYTKYWLQQLLYKYLLEKHTSLRLAAMYLLVVHPRQGARYDLIELPTEAPYVERLITNVAAAAR